MNDLNRRATAALPAAIQIALDHLDRQDNSAVAATADLATLRARLDLPLQSHRLDPVEVIEALAAGAREGLHGSSGGRFFGWVVGGSLPSALAADWLTSAWDQNAALYACAPAAAVVEETAGRWLKELLGLPVTASFAFVTGCQMAHLTCLAAARHALLAARGWNVEQDGLWGAPPIRVLTSTERHGSTVRALKLLGFGAAQITGLPVDEAGRLSEHALQAALAADASQPTILILQAGDLNIGAYDNFARLIPLAKQHNAWVHIDGAFGLWAAASPRFRHMLAGAEQADSWATDGHKWLNVPYDSGYAFVADAGAHRAAFTHRAAYIRHDDEARDPMEWNPEWSRRARGFATYAALRELGLDGVAALIDRTCDYAAALVRRIGGLPGAEVLWAPTINQGLLRFLAPSEDASERDHDEFTDQVIAAILADGAAFFTGTTWRGRRAMRVSVSNWQTSDSEVDRTCAAVAAVLQRLRDTKPAQPKPAGGVQYAGGSLR